jgi:type VI secretion system protein ImpJ
MSNQGHVHWQEGLFLQPHHLQIMQRHALERQREERRLRLAYPWGVVDAEISTEALKNNRVQFIRLHAILRSGLEVVVPDLADLPPLDITAAFGASSAPLTVYLGVPQWEPARANAVEAAESGAAHRHKRQYRVLTRDFPDENTGANPQPIPLRRVNARLMLEDDDPTDMERLPLLRVVRGVGEKADGLPVTQPGFVPPCVLLRGSLELVQLCRAIANLVEATRTDVVTQIQNRGAFDAQSLQGPALEQVLRLRILNRYASRLASLIDTPTITPFDMFLELHELLGELASLSPDRDAEVFEVYRYDHESPAVAFMNLDKRIRLLLRAKPTTSVQVRPFTPAPGGYLTATMSPADFTEPTDVFLGVKTREELSTYREAFVEGVRVKLMPAKQWNVLVPGVKLEWEHEPPATLQPDLKYFRLIRSGDKWEQAKAEGKLAFRWVGKDLASWDVALYLVFPLQEAKKKP